MYCNNCGAEINDQAVVCPKCGVPTSKLSSFGTKEPAPHSVSALICGIFSLFIPILGIVLAIISICLSVSGKNKVRKNPERYDSTSMLTVAMVLSIICIIGWIAFIVYACVVGYGLFEVYDIFEDLLYL